MKDWRDMPRGAIVGVLQVYKRFLSPFLPPACRFYPTCSEYAMEAFRVHGLGRAAWLSIKRLVRCGPWSAGGYDPVPAKAPPTQVVAAETEPIQDSEDSDCWRGDP